MITKEQRLINKGIAQQEFPIISEDEYLAKTFLFDTGDFNYSSYVVCREQQREAFMYGLEYNTKK